MGIRAYCKIILPIFRDFVLTLFNFPMLQYLGAGGRAQEIGAHIYVRVFVVSGAQNTHVYMRPALITTKHCVILPI